MIILLLIKVRILDISCSGRKQNLNLKISIRDEKEGKFRILP